MSIYVPKPLDPILQDNYLKMLAEALGALSLNYGALRKDIWSYLIEHFGIKDKYQEFLVALYYLKHDGKLK